MAKSNEGGDPQVQGVPPNGSDEAPAVPAAPAAPDTAEAVLSGPQDSGGLAGAMSVEDDVLSIFDPDRAAAQKKPAAKPDGDGKPPAEPAAPAPAAGAQSQEAAPEPPPTPAPQQPQPDQITQLMEVVRQQQQQIAQLVQASAQQQQQPAQAQPAAPQPPRNAPAPGTYAVTIPQQMMDAIRSEDPGQSQLGLQALIGATGAHIHQKVMDEFDSRASTMIQQQVAQAMQLVQQSQTVQQDYFGAFPAHRALLQHPATSAAVSQIAYQVAQEMGAQYWTPEVCSRVGAEVNRLFGSYLANLSQPSAPQTPTAPQQVPNIQAVQAAAVGQQGGPVPQLRPGSRIGSAVPIDPVQADISAVCLGMT